MKQFKSAKQYLKKYCHEYPKDLNALWLLARTSYWAKDVKDADFFYNEAIKLDSANVSLKQDYFIFVVNSGNIKKAHALSYEFEDSEDPSLLSALAKLNYYIGNYTKALRILKKVNAIASPLSKETKEIKDNILNVISPSIKLQTFFQKDDQPLKQINPGIEGKFYKNALLSLTLNYSNPYFSRDKDNINFSIFTIGNKFNFHKRRSAISFDIGGIHSYWEKKSDYSYSIELSKLFLNHLETNLRYGKQPYFFTRNSLNNLLLYNQYSFQLGWNNTSAWTSNASFVVNEFLSDNNYVYSLSTWLLTPPLNLKKVEFKGGYALNYITSNKNKFIAKESLATIISNYYYNPYIVGIYNPYFTPFNQQMHYLLVHLNARINSRLSIYINSNIGIYGSVKNPYLYLDKNANDQLLIQTGYSLYTFLPLEIKGKIQFKVNNQISISTEYLHRKNNFYTSDDLNLTFIKHFLNEKKSK